MKYNYVVFGTEDPYYTIGYSELNTRTDSVYLSGPIFNGSLKGIAAMIRRAHMTQRIRKYVELPWKNGWNDKLYIKSFQDTKPICFIFFSAGPFADHIPYGFIDYLKTTYPESRYVVFYQDLVGSNARTVSLDTYKEKMDLLLSFDYDDCEKYGMLYHPLVYSDVANTIVPLEHVSDIYFCGAEKNRLNEIIDAYKFFKGLGFSCDFNVITSKEELLQRKDTEINYCSSFSYKENLRHVKSCNAMLEIMQKGGTGYTIRALECVAFNRKLITNNRFIKRAGFYDSQSFMNYNKDIDKERYTEFMKNESTSYSHMNEVLPHRLLEYIEANLP